MFQFRNKQFLQIFSTSLLLIILQASLYSGSAQTYSRQIGEKLTYKVKWGFIRLGTVSMETCSVSEIDSFKLHHIRFHLDSNPILFFVDMHSVFDCYLDSLARPHKYIASEMVSGEFKKAVYNFNYVDSLFTIDFYSLPDTTKPRRVTLPLTEPVFDGISLISLSRQMIAQKQTRNVVAFLDDELGRVELNYSGSGKPVKIKAVNQKIPSYYVSGMIKMKGIAGVTGPFEGWFAADSQRPPLFAKLKVFVGNVVVELEEWDKWSPPK